ncbi:MAG: hypothetical protein FDW93_06815 [Bergeyella sp.]|nr:hypothetical protein [Bergeyella sp.]
MITKEKIQGIVVATLKDFLDINGIEFEGDITPQTRLIGSGGVFDSMELVNFVVDLEEILEEEFDQEFSLQDERAMSRRRSPFMNVEELTSFILELNEEGE